MGKLSRSAQQCGITLATMAISLGAPGLLDASPDSICSARTNEQTYVEDFAEYVNCQPLPVGTELRVNDRTNESPTQIPRQFKLRRKDAVTYQVELNMKFIEDSVSRGVIRIVSAKENARESAARARVQHCFNEIRPYLRGPDGSRLEFTLADPTKAKAEDHPLEIPIEVGKGDKFQIHSRGFTAEMSCLAVLHETLHLLGLVDEYVEIRSKLADGRNLAPRNCRVVGDPSSIMNDVVASKNSTAEFLDRNKFIWVRGEVCTCLDPKLCSENEPDLECRQPGFKKEFRTIHINKEIATETQARLLLASSSPSRSTGMFGSTMSNAKLDRVLTIKLVDYSEMPEDSFLLPAHFRFITRPLCKSTNRKYSECALRSNSGTDKESCLQAPSHCLDGSWLK